MASLWPISLVGEPDPEKDPLSAYASTGRDLATQSTLSVVLGLVAFTAFCVSSAPDIHYIALLI